MDYERVVLENLPLVDSVVRFIARRHGLTADEADELGGSVRLKLVENDYEVLRRFEHRSNLRTYLTTVIQRHFLDQRIARWGKWRPSAQARRLGPTAMLLDQLLNRDAMSFDEAVNVIQSRHATPVSREALHAVMLQLGHRSPRRFLGEEELAHVASPADDEKRLIDSLDRQRREDSVERALGAALARLGPQDRLVLKLRFYDECKIARIAEMLEIPQKAMYRRMEQIMGVLREELEARGVDHADAAALLQRAADPLGDILDPPGGGKNTDRPSVP